MPDRYSIEELLGGFDSIHLAEKFAEGVLHGLQFAYDCGGQMASVIKRKGELLTSVENELTTENQVYEQGYLVGLDHALLILENSIANPRNFQPSELFSDQLQFDLNWQQIFIIGIQDALAFARERQNRFQEITYEFEIRSKWVSDLSNLSRTTKREYLQGYLVGLDMAMKIIAKTSP